MEWGPIYHTDLSPGGILNNPLSRSVDDNVITYYSPETYTNDRNSDKLFKISLKRMRKGYIRFSFVAESFFVLKSLQFMHQLPLGSQPTE